MRGEGLRLSLEASHKPFYYLPDGNVVTMFERGYVPYLADTLDNVACPAAVIPLAAEGNLVVAPPVPSASGGSPPADNPIPAASGGLPPADNPIPVPAAPEAQAGGRKVRALELSIKDRPKTLEHLLTHYPKNPYCSTCLRGQDAVGADAKPQQATFGQSH